MHGLPRRAAVRHQRAELEQLRLRPEHVRARRPRRGERLREGCEHGRLLQGELQVVPLLPAEDGAEERLLLSRILSRRATRPHEGCAALRLHRNLRRRRRRLRLRLRLHRRLVTSDPAPPWSGEQCGKSRVHGVEERLARRVAHRATQANDPIGLQLFPSTAQRETWRWLHRRSGHGGSLV